MSSGSSEKPASGAARSRGSGARDASEPGGAGGSGRESEHEKATDRRPLRCAFSHAQTQSPTGRPRVPVAERARAGRTGREPSIPAPGFGAGERETGRAAAGATRPVGGDAGQAFTSKTGMPSARALSTRFSLMPPPGKATRPVGRSLRSCSLRRKGAARPWAFQSGLNTT